MLSTLAKTFAKSAIQSLTPLFDRIIVERFVAPTKTNSGVFIPETVKKLQNEGTVISVGPGKRDKNGNYKPLSLKPGDRVVLADWGGNEVKIDGKEYLVLREDDILGVIE